MTAGTCAARGCTQPAEPRLTYWVPGKGAFHLCREHWRRIGRDGRAQLWRELGLIPPDELAG